MSSRIHLAPEFAATLSLQTASGGSTTLVVLVFVALFVATGLSVYLALRLYRGYRTGGGSAMLALLIGLVLLTTVPFTLRLLLSNVGRIDTATRALAATSSQLVGLLIILSVVYVRD